MTDTTPDVEDEDSSPLALSAPALWTPPEGVDPSVDVLDFGVSPLLGHPAMMAGAPVGVALVPRVGPCSAWITRADIQARPKCSTLDNTLCTTMAAVASEVLYQLSGRQFTGALCGPVTVRPIARYVDGDQRGWARFMPGGYLTASSFWNTYGADYAGMALHYGESEPPWVDLGAYPVTAITQVVMDGVVIPSNEYRLDRYRQLVRVRPTPTSQPTDRWGWPTTQRLDMPATEVGTFAVSYQFGMAPPPSGVLAAAALGAELALRATPSSTNIPASATTVSRQGVSATVARLFGKFRSDGELGVPEADLFVGTYNPSGGRRPASVFSPDLPASRRTYQ